MQDNTSITSRLLKCMQKFQASPARDATHTKGGSRFSLAFSDTRKSRRVVGIDWQHDTLLMAECVHAGSGSVTLEALHQVDLPPGLTPDAPEFAAFLHDQLQRHYPQAGRQSDGGLWVRARQGIFHARKTTNVEFWAMLPDQDTDAYAYRIPLVPMAERENLAAWMARRDYPLDDTTLIFDCQVGASCTEQGVKKLAVTGASAPREAVPHVVETVARAGYHLHGVLTPAAATGNLLTSGWLPPQDISYAIIDMSEHGTRIDLIANNTVMFCRTIKTGFSSFVDSIAEEWDSQPLPPIQNVGVRECQNEGPPAPVVSFSAVPPSKTQVRAALLRDADPSVKSADADGHLNLEALLVPRLGRLLRQIERTTEHFVNVMGHAPIRHIYLTTPGGCMRTLAASISRHFNVPSTSLHEETGAVTQGLTLDISCLPWNRRDIAYAVGASLAREANSVNLLRPYAVRQKERQIQRISFLTTWITIALLLVLGAVTLSLQMKCTALRADELRLKAEIEAAGIPVHEQMLQEIAGHLVQLRGDTLKVQVKQGGPAFFSEISLLTPTDVHITEVRLAQVPSDKDQKKPPLVTGKAGQTQNLTSGKAPAAIAVVTGYVLGDALHRETALAEFLYTLEQSPMVLTITVEKVTTPQEVATILQFVATCRLA